MGDYGIKATPPGVDVSSGSGTAVNFSSKFSTLKILSSGRGTITTNGSGNGTLTIAHNLGYAPAYYVFRKGTANFSFLDASSYGSSYAPVTKTPSTWLEDNSLNSLSMFDSYTDGTNLIVTAGSATPSTNYVFKYYIFVDLAQSYSGTQGITLTGDYGMKVSKSGIDVKTAKEYELVYSNRYKSLQYYDVSYKTANLSLPIMYASPIDSDVKTGTYVDFEHGLGYPPFFLVYGYNIPFNNFLGYNIFIPNGNYPGLLASNTGGMRVVDAFCDATRIRVSFVERSVTTGANNGPYFPAGTITVKCFPFAEDLSQ
jgi:hypothetical protein